MKKKWFHDLQMLLIHGLRLLWQEFRERKWELLKIAGLRRSAPVRAGLRLLILLYEKEFFIKQKF